MIVTAKYNRTAYVKKHYPTSLTPTYYISPAQNLLLITGYNLKFQCPYTRGIVAKARHVENCLFRITRTSPPGAVWNKWNYIIRVKRHVQVIRRPTFICACCRKRATITANLSLFITPYTFGNFSDTTTRRVYSIQGCWRFLSYSLWYRGRVRYFGNKTYIYIYIYIYINLGRDLLELLRHVIVMLEALETCRLPQKVKGGMEFRWNGTR